MEEVGEGSEIREQGSKGTGLLLRGSRLVDTGFHRVDIP